VGSEATAAHSIGSIGPMWMLPPYSTNSSMCGQGDEGAFSARSSHSACEEADVVSNIDTAHIDPGKPWQKGNNESFNGKFL
jgi:hypothetical protein